MTAPRTFRARRFGEAMTAVKAAFGPDAVILSSRQVGGGSFGMQVEVTAAPAGARVTTEASSQSEGVLVERLHRRGVPRRAADIIVKRLRVETGRVPASLERARPSLEVVLGEELVFAGGLSRGPRVVAVVGPTGVGKTTTVAKLAAHAALVQRRKVGLVSVDDYRIGGAEQLQRYADLIGVPMQSATPSELRPSLDVLASCDLVFVDTAGRSPSDHRAVAELGNAFEWAGEPIETHLCIAASTHDVELRAIIERHSDLRPARLLSTKVDEAVYHGSIVAAQTLAGLPFSYFTTGQRVPEDIEVASAARLAGWLCGEEVGA